MSIFFTYNKPLKTVCVCASALYLPMPCAYYRHHFIVVCWFFGGLLTFAHSFSSFMLLRSGTKRSTYRWHPGTRQANITTTMAKTTAI